MKTFRLIDVLSIIRPYLVKLSETKDLSFSGLSYDSRKVKKGHLFLCKGKAFKKEYLEMAKERGALAYISEKDYGVNLPLIQVSSIREVLSPLASFYYDHPEKELDFIAVTGTKGKTTSVYYLFSIFQQKALEEAGEEFPEAGYFAVSLGKNAFLSTVKNFDGKEISSSSLTTPEPLELFAFLRKARDQGVERVIMEVSSQALKYERTKGLHFKHAGFLNISPDHISAVEHKDFNDYFHSKLKIFGQADKAYVNLDSNYSQEILLASEKARERRTFSCKTKADYQAIDAKDLNDGFIIQIKERGKEEDKDNPFSFKVKSPGLFNVENALLAYAICREEGISKDTIKRAMQRVHVDGRMELSHTNDSLIHIFVDYAHNRLSYETVTKEARRLYPKSRIIALSGAVGDKAENRRRDLGEVCGSKADFLFITSDDPGHEDPSKIAGEIAKAVESVGGKYQIEIDREKAIDLAFKMAEKRAQKGQETSLLLLGKGTDAYMLLKEGRVPMRRDTDLAREYIKNYDQKNCKKTAGNSPDQG